MNILHSHLLEKYSWYRSWHEGTSYSVLHWAIFISVVAGSFIYTSKAVFQSDLQLAYANESASTSAEVVVSAQFKDVEIAERSKDSDVVVSAIAQKTKAVLETNSYGDKFVVTHVTMAVSEWLKGSTDSTIEVELIGGELNGMNMRSSIEPEPLRVGEQAVIFLNKEANGNYRVTPGKSSNEKSLLRVKKDGTLIKGLTISQLRASLKN